MTTTVTVVAAIKLLSEREILVALVDGLSNQEIAARHHLVLKTVKWYNTQIYSKLGAFQPP